MAINEQDSEALRAELERVGLRMSHMPGGGLVASAGAMRELLARLRSTAPGVTWRDVFPDLAAHWEPGRPETWTAPYRPFGPYDYQELPTGPAVHVHWSRDMSPGFLDDLLAAARGAGWPVYGAGLIEISNPNWPTIDAMLVLKRGTTEDQTGSFTMWLDDQSGVRVATVPRTGTETYLPG